MRADPKTVTHGPQKCSVRKPRMKSTTARSSSRISRVRECGPSSNTWSSGLGSTGGAFGVGWVAPAVIGDVCFEVFAIRPASALEEQTSGGYKEHRAEDD